LVDGYRSVANAITERYHPQLLIAVVRPDRLGRSRARMVSSVGGGFRELRSSPPPKSSASDVKKFVSRRRADRVEIRVKRPNRTTIRRESTRRAAERSSARSAGSS
jgi:hypothetical protein